MLVSPNWKKKTPRDEKYLAWLLTQPCAKCGRVGWVDENGRRQGMIYHHQPKEGEGAKGQKTSDRRAVPLCCYTIRGKGCHEIYGEVGRDTFWKDYDVESLILELNHVYDKM